MAPGGVRDDIPCCCWAALRTSWTIVDTKMEQSIDTVMTTLLESYLPLLVVVVICAVALAMGHIFLLARHKELGGEARLPRQLVLFVMTLLSLVLMLIVAPLPDPTRNNILTLLGIGLSAVIALSSTSFVTNFMAAVMLRVTRPFKVGDFIRVGELFGKVSERGLFDTEIQTENRELIAIPNATFITQSVSVVRSSGVIVSTTLSLGYDVGYADVEPLMLEAATEAGLSDPYVHILALDDFSISYRVAGLLKDLEGILTARSKLHHQLLRFLHGAGVEIVSPTITRHITQSAEHKILPEGGYTAPSDNAVLAETIVFDKANEIAKLASLRGELEARVQQLKQSSAEGSDTAPILEHLERIDEELQALRKQT